MQGYCKENNNIEEKITIDAGKTETLKVIGTTVAKWSSSNQSIATVENGKITGIKGGNGQSSSAMIGWKLYDDEGYVVETGTAYCPSVAQGDKWRDEEEIVFDLKPGIYRLEVLSVD